MRILLVWVLLFFAPLVSMESNKKQLEVCPSRRAYTQELAQQKQSASEKKEQRACVFCDAEILAKNYILHENADDDVRTMMNKNPYFDFDQGQHLLIMPMSHIEEPDKFTVTQVHHQADAVHFLCKQLHDGALTQECFTNWGKIAGQSVPHWHSQLKNFVRQPLSLKERMKAAQSPCITTIEEAFEETKKLLEETPHVPRSFFMGDVPPQYKKECLCCQIMKKKEDDEDNFVVLRMQHNYVCLSHYPNLPGEVSVVPYNHVSSIKDLSQDAFREHMVIAMALFPKVKKYAQEFIRECGGGNLFTKNMGGKGSVEKQCKYHVHTRVMPRVGISSTPGNLNGNSCKLDVDPLHFFEYLKSKKEELKVAMQ